MHPQSCSNLIVSIAPNKIRLRRMQRVLARHFLKQALLAVLFSFSGALPAMASPLQLPAIIKPPSQEHHTGKVIFVELVTPDLVAAKRFYAGLFGWTFRDIQAGETAYAEATLDGRPVAGLFRKDLPPGKQQQPSWLSFISVKDVDAAKTIEIGRAHV